MGSGVPAPSLRMLSLPSQYPSQRRPMTFRRTRPTLADEELDLSRRVPTVVRARGVCSLCRPSSQMGGWTLTRFRRAQTEVRSTDGCSPCHQASQLGRLTLNLFRTARIGIHPTERRVLRHPSYQMDGWRLSRSRTAQTGGRPSSEYLSCRAFVVRCGLAPTRMVRRPIELSACAERQSGFLRSVRRQCN